MHDFSPLFPFGPAVMLAFLPLLLILVVWTIGSKGYALWRAAHDNQKWWFVALLLINTLGILEVIYLIWFAPQGSNKLNTRFHSTPAGNSSP